MEITIQQALQRGVAAHNSGNAPEAERIYRAILQSQPKHPDASHNLGLIAISMNQIEAALPLFKTALDVNPMIEQFWISYIDALVKNNQFKDARRAIKKAKQKGFDAGRLKALLSQSKVTADLKAPSQVQLSRLLEDYENGLYDDAEKLAASLTEQFPKHPFSWKVLGAVFEQTGRNSRALDAYQIAVTLSPYDADSFFNMGGPLQKLGSLEEAEARYKQAIALKPDFAEAYSNLGGTLQELGRLDEAEASYMQAIMLKPDLADSHNNLGMALAELGRLDEAEASYTQAITLRPYYTDALKHRWILLFNRKEFGAAFRDAELMISKGASQFDLTTLYALGRIEEIFERIEMRSEVDGENISIAAFAAFIAEAEKKNTAYNFCPNPIDFLRVTNLSSHIKDSAAFVAEIIEELNQLGTIWEPQATTTVSGFQSPNGVNLFESPSGKLAQLKAIILDEIDTYYLKFREKSCSYIKKWPSKIILNGWHVVLKQQGYQTAHIHPSGWLSGVIYLKVVPSLGKDEGAIEFSLNGEHYTNIRSSNLTHHPEVGDIIFFPSSLHHRTIPFTTDADRIIVSFDMKPEASKDYIPRLT